MRIKSNVTISYFISLDGGGVTDLLHRGMVEWTFKSFVLVVRLDHHSSSIRNINPVKISALFFWKNT